MPMYDLSRAYGLGYITNILSGNEVMVKDMGPYFLVESIKNPNLENIYKLSVLSGEDLDWRSIFITTKSKEKQEKKQKEIRNFLSEKTLVEETLEVYKELNQPRFLNSNTNGETLSQALDIGGAKGIREEIRSGMRPIKKQSKSKEEGVRPSSYNEGNQIYIPQEDFILSVIGHLHFTIWKWSGRGNDFKKVSIMLNPDLNGANIGGMGNLRDLKNSVQEVTKGSKAGILATLCGTAVNIAKKSCEVQQDSRMFSPRFSSLLYGVLAGAGQQMKPYGGGIYPLDFLNKLSASDSAMDIFDMWSDIFKKSNMRGHEDLAIYLSEFITYPSMDTLERYLKVHLRFFISKDTKIRLYEEKVISEVMQYV